MKGRIYTIVRDADGGLAHRSEVEHDDIDAAIANHIKRHGIDETQPERTDPAADPDAAPKSRARKRSSSGSRKRR